MLEDKLRQSLAQKDQLFRLKASKLREIKAHISQLEERIAEKHHFVDNELEPRLQEAMTSLLETEEKIDNVQTARSVLARKLDQAEAHVDELRLRETKMIKERDVLSQIAACRRAIDSLKK